MMALIMVGVPHDETLAFKFQYQFSSLFRECSDIVWRGACSSSYQRKNVTMTMRPIAMYLLQSCIHIGLRSTFSVTWKNIVFLMQFTKCSLPIHAGALSIHQTALFHLAAWLLLCQAVVPTARALPSSSLVLLLCLMPPSSGMVLSPHLFDSQASSNPTHYMIKETVK